MVRGYFFPIKPFSARSPFLIPHQQSRRENKFLQPSFLAVWIQGSFLLRESAALHFTLAFISRPLPFRWTRPLETTLKFPYGLPISYVTPSTRSPVLVAQTQLSQTSLESFWYACSGRLSKNCLVVSPLKPFRNPPCAIDARSLVYCPLPSMFLPSTLCTTWFIAPTGYGYTIVFSAVSFLFTTLIAPPSITSPPTFTSADLRTGSPPLRFYSSCNTPPLVVLGMADIGCVLFTLGCVAIMCAAEVSSRWSIGPSGHPSSPSCLSFVSGFSPRRSPLAPLWFDPFFLSAWCRFWTGWRTFPDLSAGCPKNPPFPASQVKWHVFAALICGFDGCRCLLVFGCTKYVCGLIAKTLLCFSFDYLISIIGCLLSLSPTIRLHFDILLRRNFKLNSPIPFAYQRPPPLRRPTTILPFLFGLPSSTGSGLS